MKDEINRWMRKSREHMPILVGFFTLVVLVALIIGFIMFFYKRKSQNK